MKTLAVFAVGLYLGILTEYAARQIRMHAELAALELLGDEQLRRWT